MSGEQLLIICLRRASGAATGAAAPEGRYVLKSPSVTQCGGGGGKENLVVPPNFLSFREKDRKSVIHYKVRAGREEQGSFSLSVVKLKGGRSVKFVSPPAAEVLS